MVMLTALTTALSTVYTISPPCQAKWRDECHMKGLPGVTCLIGQSALQLAKVETENHSQ